jgi:hypothetical protein
MNQTRSILVPSSTGGAVAEEEANAYLSGLSRPCDVRSELRFVRSRIIAGVVSLGQSSVDGKRG